MTIFVSLFCNYYLTTQPVMVVSLVLLFADVLINIFIRSNSHFIKFYVICYFNFCFQNLNANFNLCTVLFIKNCSSER